MSAITPEDLTAIRNYGFVRSGDGGVLRFASGSAPAGPWSEESDVERFVHRDVPCVLLRNRMGAWCGYVGVPAGHPWFQAHDLAAEVHGGVTFGEMAGSFVICDGAPIGDEALWWVGFDCCHAWDVMPGELAIRANRGYPDALRPSGGGVPEWSYKTVEFARAEVMRLADQAIAAGRPA